MDVQIENIIGHKDLPSASDLDILGALKYPVCIINADGILSYRNKSFLDLFDTGNHDTRLDWQHPFFPEYRKRIAQAYLSAMKGSEKRCLHL